MHKKNKKKKVKKNVTKKNDNGTKNKYSLKGTCSTK